MRWRSFSKWGSSKMTSMRTLPSFFATESAVCANFMSTDRTKQSQRVCNSISKRRRIKIMNWRYSISWTHWRNSTRALKVNKNNTERGKPSTKLARSFQMRLSTINPYSTICLPLEINPRTSKQLCLQSKKKGRLHLRCLIEIRKIALLLMN